MEETKEISKEENEIVNKTNENNEINPYLGKILIQNSNPFPFFIDKINLLTNEPTFLLFSAESDMDKYFSLTQTILEKSNFESFSISSIFVIPPFEDKFFIEVNSENIKENEKSKIIEEIENNFQIKIKEENISNILLYFLNIHYFSYLNSENNIFRINDPLLPIIHEKPCQILDINFIKKECICSINCEQELINLSKESTILDHLSHEKRVFLNYSKTKYLDNGFCLKDENYLSIYKIIKIKMEKLITPEFAQITDEEKLLFTHKYDENIEEILPKEEIKEENKENIEEENKTEIKEENNLENEEKAPEEENDSKNEPKNEETEENKEKETNATIKNTKELNANFNLSELYISILPSVYQKKLKDNEEENEENLFKQDIVSLYSLVRIPETLSIGVIIDISLYGYTILMSDNSKLDFPLTSQIYTLTDDNSGRDVENHRIFINDCVRIVAKNSPYKHFSSSVIHVYNKKIFGNFSNGYKTYQLFVDSKDTLLAQDDEGPI